MDEKTLLKLDRALFKLMKRFDLGHIVMVYRFGTSLGQLALALSDVDAVAMGVIDAHVTKAVNESQGVVNEAMRMYLKASKAHESN